MEGKIEDLREQTKKSKEQITKLNREAVKLRDEIVKILKQYFNTNFVVSMTLSN